MFAAMPAPRTDPKGYGNVFGNPAGGFMALICFANGSLAREAIAKRFNLSWDDFTRAILERTKPGSGGNMVLPYFVPEITPRLPAPAERWFGSPDFVAGKDPNAAARAVVEEQALSMRLHSAFIGQPPSRILVTGGASKNAGILRVLADVFQAEIVPLRVGNSSALGGALRAAQAVEGRPWADLYAKFAAPDLTRRVAPDLGSKMTYEGISTQLQQHLKDLLAETPATR
jgi:xylulokinase